MTEFEIKHGLSQDEPGPLEPVDLAKGAPVVRGAAGWKLVPATITLDMEVAFAETWFSKVRCIDDAEMQDAYAAMLAAAPASPVSTVAQAEAVAWMDPQTLDVINADRKASWLADFGAGAAAKATTYTRALGDLHPAPAAGDALDAARYRWLTEDHADPVVRKHRNDILRRMSVMSHSAASADIDAAIAAQRQGDA